jgi:xylulokinase
LWTQIKADVCGRRFVVPQVEESVALGAALLAGMGAGAFSNAEQAVASVRRTQQIFAPDADAVRDYDRWYTQVYLHLYSSLRDINRTIEALTADE